MVVEHSCNLRRAVSPKQASGEKQLKGWVWVLILEWGFDSKNVRLKMEIVAHDSINPNCCCQWKRCARGSGEWALSRAEWTQRQERSPV